VLGSFLAFLSAVTFAFNNASLRRGVLTGSITQAMAITVPIGFPMFLAVVLVGSAFGLVASFPSAAIPWMALVGVLHFIGGRYCNYRSTRAIGANLSAPIIQLSLVVSLVLAVLLLGEQLTPLRILGIVLLVLGPMLTGRGDKGDKNGNGANGANGGANGAAAAQPRPVFKPSYAEGYTFGLLSACAYGTTPVIVRSALMTTGSGGSFVGGLIAYGAATAVVGLLLLRPGSFTHVLSIKRETIRWFAYSGIFVCLSQMFVYMAYSLAPVSVVSPILQLQLLFRVYFARLLNPHHEVFGSGMMLGTVLSLIGAVMLSLSTEFLLSLVHLPDGLAALARWHWP
jgi:drug/metabolite transporter (DMT)-like permease